MKTKFYKYLSISFISLFVLTGFTGCTKEYKDYITEEHYWVGSEATNYSFTVDVSGRDRWSWNNQSGRYECYFDFQELSADIYNYGSMVAGVFVNPQENDEWLEMLPYYAVYQGGVGVNISCAFTPGEVGFFLSPSNRTENSDILGKYEFRVTLMLDQYNLPED